MKDSKLHGKDIKNVEFPLMQMNNVVTCLFNVFVEMFYEGHSPVTYELMDLSNSTLCSIRAFILF